MRSLDSRPVNLILLPFAGAGFYAYRDFRKYLPEFIHLTAVDLPGHGKRMREPLLANIHDMVKDIFDQVKPILGEPYAIYGHSMGAGLGFLLTRRIAEQGAISPPLHLFFSGKSGPEAEVQRGLHCLPKEDFISALMDYGGIPDEVLDHDELLELFIPILRADFKTLDSYVYEPGEPLDIPMTIMLGTGDRLTRGKEIKWPEVTEGTLEIRQFQGNHFFIFDHLPEICRIITATLGRQGKK